jgi:hypothetical protein
MNRRGYVTAAMVSLLALGSLAVGARFWSVAHVQRWTGRQDLGFVNCSHCHLQRIEKLPWAQARPRHPAPAALAVSPMARSCSLPWTT